jgi:hypothetical protein
MLLLEPLSTFLALAWHQPKNTHKGCERLQEGRIGRKTPSPVSEKPIRRLWGSKSAR